MNPQESLRRAHNRTWIEPISTLLVMRNRLQNAQTEQESRELAGCINRERQHMKCRLGQGPFFNGKGFSLVDAAAVPLFQRLHWVLELVPDPGLLDGVPKLRVWRDNLLHRPSVTWATSANLRRDYLEYLRQQTDESGAPGCDGPPLACSRPVSAPGAHKKMAPQGGA